MCSKLGELDVCRLAKPKSRQLRAVTLFKTKFNELTFKLLVNYEISKTSEKYNFE